MGNVNDYWRTLEFKINNVEKAELLHSVIESKLFNSEAYSERDAPRPDTFIKLESREGTWYRTKKGYSFYGTANKGLDVVTGQIDTVAMEVKFNYASD